MIIYRGASTESSFFVTIILYVVATFTASSFFLISVVFPYNNKPKVNTIFFTIFLNILIILLVIKSNVVIKDVLLIEDQEKQIIFGSFYFLYFLYIIGLFSVGTYNLFKKYVNEKGLIRLQLRYILIGSFLGASLAMLTNLILPWMGIFYLNWAGQIFTLVMPIFMIYAIIRYRLLGIKIIANKIFIYSFLSCLLFLFFSIIYFVNYYILKVAGSAQTIMFGLFFAFLLSIIILPLLEYAQKISDKIFYGGRNPEKAVNNLIFKLNKIIDINELFNMLSKELLKLISTEKIGLMIFPDSYDILENKQKKVMIKEKIITNYYLFKEIDDYIEGLCAGKEILIKDEVIDNEKIIRKLESFGIEILNPLVSNKKIIGFIVLGKKVLNEAYTKEEIELIELVSKRAIDAIINSIKVRQYERKINEYKHLYSNFSAITKEQISTPLMITSNILKASIRNEKNEDQKDKIKSSLRRNEQVARIIDNFITASEIEAGTLNFEFKPTDILSLFKEIINDGKYKNRVLLKIKNIDEKNPPLINTNRAYVRKAIVNILENALLYGKNEKVKVIFKKHEDRLIIEAIDSGIGISEKDKNNIFNKFYRGEEAKKINKNGLGLGLYTAKKIIEKHGAAKIYFKTSGNGKSNIFVVEFKIL